MPDLTVEALLHHRAEELREIKDRVIVAYRALGNPTLATRLLDQLVGDLMLKLREAEEQYMAF